LFKPGIKQFFIYFIVPQFKKTWTILVSVRKVFDGLQLALKSNFSLYLLNFYPT